jgi:hypothetical protein
MNDPTVLEYRKLISGDSLATLYIIIIDRSQNLLEHSRLAPVQLHFLF